MLLSAPNGVQERNVFRKESAGLQAEMKENEENRVIKVSLEPCDLDSRLLLDTNQ